MERIEEFIKLEEDMGAPEPRWTHPTDEGYKRKRRRQFGEVFDRKTGHTEPTRATFEVIYTIFKGGLTQQTRDIRGREEGSLEKSLIEKRDIPNPQEQPLRGYIRSSKI